MKPWLVGAALALTSIAHADPRPELALLAPPPGDDARKAIALGPHGEVYAPEGGRWVRTQRISTASTLTVAGRSGGDVVAAGDGVVYRLAANGWSAIRLHQKDKAVLAPGVRAVAAVKRQLYRLEMSARGEPEKLALAPAAVLAIGAGNSIVIATDRGLARVTGTKVQPLASAPRQVRAMVDDRWAILATGAHDLRASKTTPWPAGAAVTAFTSRGDSLVAVGLRAGKLELLTVAGGKLDVQPIAVTPGTPVGVAADRAGRVVIALADGRVVVRDGDAWTASEVTDQLPGARPGPGAARAP